MQTRTGQSLRRGTGSGVQRVSPHMSLIISPLTVILTSSDCGTLAPQFCRSNHAFVS